MCVLCRVLKHCQTSAGENGKICICSKCILLSVTGSGGDFTHCLTCSQRLDSCGLVLVMMWYSLLLSVWRWWARLKDSRRTWSPLLSPYPPEVDPSLLWMRYHTMNCLYRTEMRCHFVQHNLSSHVCSVQIHLTCSHHGIITSHIDFCWSCQWLFWQTVPHYNVFIWIFTTSHTTLNCSICATTGQSVREVGKSSH